MLRGRDHPALGACAVAEIGGAVAVGISAGTETKPGQTDPNEDVGAAVDGRGAALLVVADGHFGAEAAEAAVARILGSVGLDPRNHVSDAELVELFYEAGVAVQRATTLAGCPHPNSRTTLALAVVDEDAVRWASVGDSCVVGVARGIGTRLDRPRPAYLGDRFSLGDLAATMSLGELRRENAERVLVATDGLLDALADDGLDIGAAVLSIEARDASPGRLVHRLITWSLQRSARDAITVAIA